MSLGSADLVVLTALTRRLVIVYGDGYLMAASDGGTLVYSNKPFDGSLGNQALPAPITGVAA